MKVDISSMKKIIISLFLVLPSVCFAHDSVKTPELWSWFKELNKSAEACNIQSMFELEKLGIKKLVSNQYGQYGVFRSNRIVVKCLPRGTKSTLVVAVAGYDRDSAELLRNKIISIIE